MAAGDGALRVGVDQRRFMAGQQPVGGQAAGEGGFADATL
jgi:hypothetical protein